MHQKLGAVCDLEDCAGLRFRAALLGLYYRLATEAELPMVKAYSTRMKTGSVRHLITRIIQLLEAPKGTDQGDSDLIVSIHHLSAKVDVILMNPKLLSEVASSERFFRLKSTWAWRVNSVPRVRWTTGEMQKMNDLTRQLLIEALRDRIYLPL